MNRPQHGRRRCFLRRFWRRRRRGTGGGKKGYDNRSAGPHGYLVPGLSRVRLLQGMCNLSLFPGHRVIRYFVQVVGGPCACLSICLSRVFQRRSHHGAANRSIYRGFRQARGLHLPYCCKGRISRLIREIWYGTSSFYVLNRKRKRHTSRHRPSLVFNQWPGYVLVFAAKYAATVCTVTCSRELFPPFPARVTLAKQPQPPSLILDRRVCDPPPPTTVPLTPLAL